MSDNVFYPCHSLNSKVHIIEIKSKKMLCGRAASRFWEMEYMGDIFPEVGKYVEANPITKGPGFYIGRWFCGEYEFCETCFNKLKEVKNV